MSIQSGCLFFDIMSAIMLRISLSALSMRLATVFLSMEIPVKIIIVPKINAKALSIHLIRVIYIRINPMTKPILE